MKSILRFTLDFTAYILLFVVYYTLRLVKSPFWWIPIDSYIEWIVSERTITNDIMVFIVILVLIVLYAIQGLWWLLYGAIGLLTLFFATALFFWLRKKWKTR